MRINIVLDDELIREARRYSKARTKRALVEEALRTLVRVRAEEQRRASYRDRLAAVDMDRIQWLRLNQAVSDRVAHQTGYVVNPKLFHDVRPV